MQTLVRTEEEFDFDAYFADFHARREQERAEFHARALEHLQAGGMIREFWANGEPSDWTVTESRSAEWTANHLAARKMGFSLTHEFLPGDAAPWRPACPEGAMPIERIRAAVAARGYTHVVTFGGPMPLDEWTPYGSDRWFGTVRDDDTVIDTPYRPQDPNSQFVLGVWSFTTL